MWSMTLNARYWWTYGDNEHQPNLGTNSSRRQRPRVGIFGKDVSDIRHGTCQGTLCCEEHEARYRGERGEVLPKRGDGRGRGDGEREGKDERGNDMRGTKTGLQRGSFKQRRDGVAGCAHSYFVLFVPSFYYFYRHFFFSQRCLDYVIRHAVPLRASPGLAERHGVCLH